MFLPGESQGRGSLVGCRLWGRTESDMTEVTQQQQHRVEFGISDIQCYIKEEEKEREEKKSHKNYKKKYRYKIDNKYQKAKIKNLE